ncbi:MAG: PTS sugar transporter subunit IIC [Erysipelotrichaceae bacterium]|jgi:fructoselysine and glucoselysine-specific PTS system IIC component|nr:PTS sugar transporter subunit IIC [Erysipelotrichaceae bacterium]
MDNLFLTSVLIFVACCIPTLVCLVGIDLVGRPLVISAIIGAILGDLKTGIMCGATIELIWLGVFAIGASNPPDMLSGAVIGTAYVIISKAPIESAVILAVPVAALVKLINEVRWTVINVLIGSKADKYAALGDRKKVELMHWFSLSWGVFLRPVIIAVAIYFGIPWIEQVVASIPGWLSDGLMYATGIIPAIGFAMIARMILTKQTALFLFLGFILAAFFNLSIIGIAGLGCVIVAYLIFNKNQKEAVIDDNEF